MSNDHQNMLQSSSTDWDKAWDVVSRLGAARKHLEHDTAPVADGPLAADAAHVPAAADSGRRSVHRPLAVWILIGALWISIGMIVSAAIVTVAYLA